MSTDTIAAIASALGGAIAMIRLSGPRAFEISEKITGKGSFAPDPRKLYRSSLHDEIGAALDDSLVVKFISPESFTGEDVVEFQIHGGFFIASRIMEVLVSFGARQALPGEFSFRAIRNGKMSITEAQAISDLIAASNESAVDLALEKMSGTQTTLLGAIASALRKLAVLGEVGIDFSDQDVGEVSLPTLKAAVEYVLGDLRKLRDSYDRGVKVQEGIRVAFIGLPNSGKSSFFNTLLGEDRSIVSEVAGTTRDVVRERLSLRGERGSITLRLEDTAGIRNAHDQIEKIGVERSVRAAKDADLILAIFDSSQETNSDTQEWDSLQKKLNQELHPKTLGILTKIDLVSEEKRKSLLSRLKATGIGEFVETSSVTGDGIRDAVNSIVKTCEKFTARQKGEVLLTRLDHLNAVANTIAHLERALEIQEADLFASDIRQALVAMGPLIGDTLPDDILAKIFSDFCIGK